MWFRRRGERAALIEHGEEGIRQAGYRVYVGGLWDELGKLPFDFLVEHGLEPRHVVLDVACGALRVGRLLIPYLDRGHYLGIEKEPLLIQAGLEHEIAADLVAEKAPELIVSARFEFDRFSRRPDYALAQSLFSHLPPRQIRRCLKRLRDSAAPGCRLYASFFETETPVRNANVAHDHVNWQYTRDQMIRFGRSNGWNADYIGDWQHPRGQMMMCYTLPSAP